jgi:thiol:disulfide interchange protein DsbC
MRCAFAFSAQVAPYRCRATAQTATAPTANSIAERLQSLYPATRFGAVNTTPWPGVFEVVMGANLAYVDETGQYFLFGHLYDMKAQRDLTAERKDAQTRASTSRPCR